MTIPLLLIIGIIAYIAYNKYATAAEQKLAERYASFTAEVWVASAKFRKEPEKYLAFRDSLFEARGIDETQFQTFLNRYEKFPERYLQFVSLVKIYVDSIYLIEDSLIQMDPQRFNDSVILESQSFDDGTVNASG